MGLKDIISKFKKSKFANQDELCRQYPVSGDDPFLAEHELLNEFALKLDVATPGSRGRNQNVVDRFCVEEDFDKKIGTFDLKGKIAVYHACCDQYDHWSHKRRDFPRVSNSPERTCFHHWMYLWELFLDNASTKLIRKKLPFTSEDIEMILDRYVKKSHPHVEGVGYVLSRIKDYKKDNELTGQIRVMMEKLAKKLRRKAYTQDQRKYVTRIEQLLGIEQEIKLATCEAWAEKAEEDIKSLVESKQGCWRKLFAHANKGSGSKPSARWLKKAKELVEGVGEDAFKGMVPQWFGLVKKCGQNLMNNQNADILKGLVWCCSLYQGEHLGRAVEELGEVCFKKIPNIGAFSVRVGNACIYTLSANVDEKSLALLGMLRNKVKYPSARNMIAKAFEVAAEKAGVTAEELEEIAVPTFGLMAVGRLSEKIGEFTAELSVKYNNKVDLVWVKENGKAQKTVPKAVKSDFADDLKEIKAAVKDIQKTLPAQKSRIESMFLAKRRWDYNVWLERYINHVLTGALGRRLIWKFASGDKGESGMWHDGEIVNSKGEKIGWLGEDTVVTMWHPINNLDEVGGWRDWLEEKQICQPFKQAHREVYILTDAEQETNTYSNRFAAHILKQHQFSSLCQQRGWKYTLQGGWDSHNTPYKELPLWNMHVEYWVDGGVAGDEMTDVGIYLYVATDQVRFVGQGHALALQDVPALVFSEMMRDVDLFVGVASVGNDPQWHDTGPARYRDYWSSYSFGDLSATARTRKEILERLVPRLKIADRCSITDKFLVVKGDIRTYKIHMGSGNIQMEPNNQYLCIVPGRLASGKSEKVFLPFEGDRTLSIIISKAFLLADDKNIKDPTIVSQIKR